MSKKTITVGAVVAVILALVALGVYWQLGGFNPVRFTLEERESLKLMGLTYRGTPQDKEMGETFRQIESLVENISDAHLHTLYYTEPAGKHDTLEVFVGIEYDERLAESNKLDVVDIACSQIIVADIQAHRTVMPVPPRVKKELEAFAEAKGVVTQGIYIDKIIREDWVLVLAPLE